MTQQNRLLLLPSLNSRRYRGLMQHPDAFSKMMGKAVFDIVKEKLCLTKFDIVNVMQHRVSTLSQI